MWRRPQWAAAREGSMDVWTPIYTAWLRGGRWTGLAKGADSTPSTLRRAMGVPRLASRAADLRTPLQIQLSALDDDVLLCVLQSLVCIRVDTCAPSTVCVERVRSVDDARAFALTCRRFLALLCSDTASALAKELRARVHTRAPRALRDPDTRTRTSHTAGEHRRSNRACALVDDLSSGSCDLARCRQRVRRNSCAFPLCARHSATAPAPAAPRSAPKCIRMNKKQVRVRPMCSAACATQRSWPPPMHSRRHGTFTGSRAEADGMVRLQRIDDHGTQPPTRAPMDAQDRCIWRPRPVVRRSPTWSRH